MSETTLDQNPPSTKHSNQTFVDQFSMRKSDTLVSSSRRDMASQGPRAILHQDSQVLSRKSREDELG